MSALSVDPLPVLPPNPPVWLEDAHREAVDHVLLLGETGSEWCVYCSDPATQADHLVPYAISGEALRHLVPTLPACMPCNSTLGAFPVPFVVARAGYVASRVRVKNDIGQWVAYWHTAHDSHKPKCFHTEREADEQLKVLARLCCLEHGGVLRGVRRGCMPLPGRGDELVDLAWEEFV